MTDAFFWPFSYQFHPGYCHYFYPPLLAFEVCLARLTLIVSTPVDLLFGLTLIVATPELLLTLYTGRFSLKLWAAFIFVLILLIFFYWFSARTFARLPIMFACFAVNLYRMFKKHIVIRFPSKSWQGYCGWRFSGIWKSEGVFRLTSLDFSAGSYY